MDEIISRIKPCSFFSPWEEVEVVDAVFWEIECASWLSGSFKKASVFLSSDDFSSLAQENWTFGLDETSEALSIWSTAELGTLATSGVCRSFSSLHPLPERLRLVSLLRPSAQRFHHHA